MRHVKMLPYIKKALVGGVMVFIIAIAGYLLVGSVYSDILARRFIEAMLPTIRTLCFAGITAASTMLSLMLAIVGFAQRSDDNFDDGFYHQVELLALLDIILISIATIMLLFISIPITEADDLTGWYNWLYYGLMIGSSLIAGLLVTVVIVLYDTLKGVLHVMNPGIEIQK